MNPIQLKSVGLLCLLFVSAVHSWGTACPSCTQDSDFLKAASWNANLVPGISGNYQERLNGAIAYFTSPDIAAMGLDLLCLQEVYGSGQQTLIQGLQGAFPHSYAGAPAENNNQCLKVCNAQAITALNGCSASCTDANGGSDCLLNSCNQQFLALDISCQSCITSGQGSASAIINACAAQSDADINNNTTCSLFGGNSGNVILSNQPFIATETLIFNTQGSGMSNALLAKISWRGNNVNFVCTNFLPDDVMPSNAGDLATLNNQQTHELIDWVNAKVPAGEPLIVAGDFNFGPAVGSNAGLFVDNYNLMISAGFTSALIANVPADQVPCTSCNNGKFVSTHIFIKSNTNPEACVNDVNLVGSGQTVNTPNGQVALSDTAGVYATICYAGQPAPTALPTIAPAPVQTEVVVLPVQVVDDSSIRFGETSSGATALPIIMFSVAAGVALYF